MLGLFGLLDLSSRSLSTEQQGVEVAGHNLANVNNPAYARQRLNLTTSPTITGDLGPQGTGVEAVTIVQLRSGLLDSQIQDEMSVRTSLEGQQSALQLAESTLGQQFDRLSTDAASNVGTGQSLGTGLADLFSSFQSLSTDPGSLAERQSLLTTAAGLAVQFNQTDARLGQLQTSLNQSVRDDTGTANSLLTQIASLNQQISRAEAAGQGAANDLRDVRQGRLEDLAKLLKIDVAPGNGGSVNVSIAGTLMVTNANVADTLEAYDAGGGQTLVRALTAGAPLNLTAGRIQGTIEVRDGAITDLRGSMNSLASVLISEVNAVHASGFSLTGSTGASFFTGTGAADIAVNRDLISNPALVQAASVPGATGDNGVALRLAQLSQKTHPGLGNQTFGQGYGRTASDFGRAFVSVNDQLASQQVVEKMLVRQRDSISGVSLDEEMADLTRFQNAFQASARLMTVVDDMLDTVVNLKR